MRYLCQQHVNQLKTNANLCIELWQTGMAQGHEWMADNCPSAAIRAFGNAFEAASILIQQHQSYDVKRNFNYDHVLLLAARPLLQLLAYSNRLEHCAEVETILTKYLSKPPAMYATHP